MILENFTFVAYSAKDIFEIISHHTFFFVNIIGGILISIVAFVCVYYLIPLLQQTQEAKSKQKEKLTRKSSLQKILIQKEIEEEIEKEILEESKTAYRNK